MLASLLEAYREGKTDVQHALLDEVEPLLYGYLRSLVPARDDARAQAIDKTHELVLAFHLRACAGAIRLDTAKDLRRLAHVMALEKLTETERLPLAPLADPESGSMVYRCYGIGLALEEELTPAQIALFADRLVGAPATPEWPAVATVLTRLGLL